MLSGPSWKLMRSCGMPSVPRIDITLDADMEAAGGPVSSANGCATPLRLPVLFFGMGSGAEESRSHLRPQM